MSLEQLVIAAQGSSAGGADFTAVCQRFTGLVRKYANQSHLAGIKEEAEAEGWLAVAVAVRNYDRAAGVRFAGYVESRVKYAVWNLFKRERRRWQHELLLDGGTSAEDGHGPGLLDLLPSVSDVAGEVEARQLAGVVGQALAGLPHKQQVAVVKTMLDGARLAEVAEELGVTVQAVYNLRQRGLTRLKKELAGMYASERG